MTYSPTVLASVIESGKENDAVKIGGRLVVARKNIMDTLINNEVDVIIILDK